MTNRDIIVIGCSAGGVEALPRLVQQLPADLAASVMIVQHMGPQRETYLVDILQRQSKLPVAWAEQGAKVVPGRILVCPPDVHLLFSDDHVMLARSARENHSRPSIDKLFRSAAATYAGRTIAVLLTGMLFDGIAGLAAVCTAGGFTIIQDPRDAQFPDLPTHALEVIVPDRTLPLDQIAAAVREAVTESAPAATVPAEVLIAAQIDATGCATPELMHRLGPQVAISCPDCHGPMWKVGDEKARRFRCYLGHVNAAQDLIHETTVELESALWSAVRALNDRAATLETLASDAKRVGNAQTAAAYAERGREARVHAEIARKFMLDLSIPGTNSGRRDE